MYRSFYKLKFKPFHISSDPRFLWLGEKHKEALATLKYGVLDNKGFLLLTGDVGTGKTTLINTLVNSLGDDVIVAAVLDPGLSKLDFFNYIANAFGIDKQFKSKGSFLVQFGHFLHNSNAEGKKVLLIIDEAQRLNDDLLEEVRLLSNIEKQSSKLLNIFFVGQNEFNYMLLMPQNRAVRQRLTLNYNLDPLSRLETEEYIAYRLMIAGAERNFFNHHAMDEIFSYSLGFPRQINIICDLALLSGYVRENNTIDANIIRECAAELKLPENRPADPGQNLMTETGATDPPVTETQVAVNEDIILLDEPVTPAEHEGDSGVIKKGLLILITIIILTGAFFTAYPETFENKTRLISKILIRNVAQIISRIEGPHPYESKIISKVSPVSQPHENTVIEKKDTAFKKNIEEALKGKGSSDAAYSTPVNSDSSVHINDDKDTTCEKIKKVISEPGDLLHDQPNLLKKDPEANMAQDDYGKMPAIENSLPEPVVIGFPRNSNDIDPGKIDVLSGFIRVLLSNRDAKIIINGYSDSLGTASYNLKISQFRANIVKSYFLGSGVYPSQIEARGLGIENPVASNDTIDGRRANRRVEVMLNTED